MTTALARASDVGMLSLDRFPVAEQGKPQFAQRFGTDHKGTDIFAPKGTPVLAVRDGRAHASTEPKGGKVVYLTADDSSRYFYAHLDAWHSRVLDTDQVLVKSGDVLGFVGNTGNAISKPPHLHFEMSPVAGQGQVDPYPYLTGVAPPGAQPAAPLNAGAGGKIDWATLLILYFVFKGKGGKGFKL